MRLKWRLDIAVIHLLMTFVFTSGAGHGWVFLGRWLVRGFRLILLGLGALVIIGCTTDDNSGVSPESPKEEPLLYPGAPIISIEKISFYWTEITEDGFRGPAFDHKVGVLRYLLEAKQPLPYDIDVRLAFNGKSQPIAGKVYSMESIRHKHLIEGKEKPSYHNHRKPYHHQMRKGTTVLGAKVHGWRGGEGETGGIIGYENWKPVQVLNSERYSPQLANITLTILGWDGLGDAPYNVGSPSTIIVNAKEIESIE